LIQRSAAPVREQVVRALRQAIIHGRFSPGQRLVSHELCRWLGASRTTVREALRQLQAEGLVEDVPGRGPVVARVSVEEARRLYEVREALEGLAARLVAERGTSQAREELVRALDEVEQAYATGDVARMLAAKDHFYEALFRGSGNPVLHSLATTLHARISRLRVASLSQPGRPADSLAEVKAIVDAILRADPDRAEATCRWHVRRAAEVAVQGLRATEAGADDGTRERRSDGLERRAENG